MSTLNFTSMGIVFALEIESRGLKQILSHSRRIATKHRGHMAWQLGTTRVVAAVSGVGMTNAAGAAEALIGAGARSIISAGLAGALDGKAAVGDVVIANRVLRHGARQDPIRCDRELSAGIPPSGSLGYRVWQSDIVSVDRIVCDPGEKAHIYESSGAAALDMECYGVAEVCRARRVPFLSVRAVSDTASEELPPELVALLEKQGAWAQSCFILSRPHLWNSLWRMRRNALKASYNLGDSLGTMLLRISRG